MFRPPNGVRTPSSDPIIGLSPLVRRGTPSTFTQRSLCASVDVRQLSARVGEAESQVVESNVQFRLGSGLTNRKGVFYPPARMDGVLRTTHPTFYMSGLE